MAFNLISIIEEFSRLKQIDREKIAEIIKESLESTLKKRLSEEKELIVEINFDESKVVAKFEAEVVEGPASFLDEIVLEDAQKIDPNAEIGDVLTIEMPVSEFGRKTIQSARQAIVNRFKESENEKIIVDFEKQKGEIISGAVKGIQYNGYIVNIGFTDALLTTEEQIENEFYKINDFLKAYVTSIRQTKNGIRVILSRKRPEFIIKLFENEIPEIADGIVTIKKIVREPGYRTKVAVISNDENVDPYGSCIGPKGIRIEEIRKELHGEQVDIVQWSDNIEDFITNAVGPELVKRVYLADKGRFAQIIVDEDNKNVAIGKGGKNIKLAAKLTNYKLDVLLDEEYEEIAANERRITSPIYDLDGVTDKIGNILHEAGYTSVQDIHLATVEELTRIEGVGVKTAERIKESAKYF